MGHEIRNRGVELYRVTWVASRYDYKWIFENMDLIRVHPFNQFSIPKRLSDARWYRHDIRLTST